MIEITFFIITKMRIIIPNITKIFLISVISENIKFDIEVI